MDGLLSGSGFLKVCYEMGIPSRVINDGALVATLLFLHAARRQQSSKVVTCFRERVLSREQQRYMCLSTSTADSLEGLFIFLMESLSQEKQLFSPLDLK